MWYRVGGGGVGGVDGGGVGSGVVRSLHSIPSFPASAVQPSTRALC